MYHSTLQLKTKMRFSSFQTFLTLPYGQKPNQTKLGQLRNLKTEFLIAIHFVTSLKFSVLQILLQFICISSIQKLLREQTQEFLSNKNGKYAH